MTILDLKKLCEDSHNISKEKGWLDTERSFAGLTDLMHSELAEALEDYRNNKALDEIYYEATLKGADGEEDKKVILKSGELLGKSYVGFPKPCGIPIELADFVIRIAQHCGTEGWPLDEAVHAKNTMTRKLSWGDFESALAWAHVFIGRAFIASRDIPLTGVGGVGPATSTNGALDELANAYIVVQDFCMRPTPNGPRIDLAQAVQWKQQYNQTRPHRHGGKKI